MNSLIFRRVHRPLAGKSWTRWFLASSLFNSSKVELADFLASSLPSGRYKLNSPKVGLWRVQPLSILSKAPGFLEYREKCPKLDIYSPIGLEIENSRKKLTAYKIIYPSWPLCTKKSTFTKQSNNLLITKPLNKMSLPWLYNYIIWFKLFLKQGQVYWVHLL